MLMPLAQQNQDTALQILADTFRTDTDPLYSNLIAVSVAGER